MTFRAAGLLLSATCLASFVMMGCSSAGDSASTHVCAPPPPAPATQSADTSTVQGFAESGASSKIDQLVGRYLRREAVIYRGTVDAHDTQGLGFPPPPPGQSGNTDQTMPSQPAFATLTRGNGTVLEGMAFTDADVLAVHGVTTMQYVQFAQVKSQPGVTFANVILGDTSSGGNTTSCTGCTVSFAELPATLSFSNLTGTAMIPVTDGTGKNKNVMLEVVASVSLDAVAPCDLTFDDLETTGPAGFVLEGDEMVLHDKGTDDSTPPASRGQCGGTAYTIDLYVNRSNLADYGVRNFRMGATGVLCPP
jgi:hypothetical protein